MKFFLLGILATIPSVGICYLLLYIEVFRENDFLFKIAVLIVYCAIFYILAKLFKLK